MNETIEVIGAPPINPLDPEAPIHHLLDVNRNPAVKDMTTEQLNALITKIRANATSPQTLTATLQNDAKRKRPVTEAQRKRREMLDSI
jgi:TPP-dependent 2-oxoacid decarboxylase